MAKQCFEALLSDEEMRAQLILGAAFFIRSPTWQAVERQIERLGFEDQYFVTQVSAKGGKFTKVAPATPGQTREAA